MSNYYEIVGKIDRASFSGMTAGDGQIAVLDDEADQILLCEPNGGDGDDI
jgi:hypothetical protein